MAYVNDAWLEGVRDAAKWAHDNYSDTEQDDIIDAVISAKVRDDVPEVFA